MATKDSRDPIVLARDARERNTHYHIYVRLPFKRGDFIEPPPYLWDEAKSDALWATISSGAHTEMDWHELAARFGVTVEYILQMASYLTDRHTAQLRAQMRKAVTSTKSYNATVASPVPRNDSNAALAAAQGALTSAASEAMKRAGSLGSGRAPSPLSTRRNSLLSRKDGSGVASPRLSLTPRPSVSRTATNSPVHRNVRRIEPTRRPPSSLTISHVPTTKPQDIGNETSPGPASSADEDEDEYGRSSSSSSPIQSRIIRRPPRFQSALDGARSFPDESDEAEPAFLPYSATQAGRAYGNSAGNSDLGATLRGNPRVFGRRRYSREIPTQQSQTSDSSNSSAALLSKDSVTDDRTGSGITPLSPRRTAELSGKGKSRGYSREGSDGTPSMGSSFSDLDDASVTQSAMEEALASRMQDDTISSRMSTIGAAIRSRYLPQTKDRQ